MKNVVFLDRDGTIIREPRDKQIDSLEKLEFIPGIIRGLRLLVDFGFSLVMVSNQDGLGTSRYPREAFRAVQKKILRLLQGEGIIFERIFICPHRPEEACECRKPKTGLLRRYLQAKDVDFSKSFVLGDRTSDVEFARNLGCRCVRLIHRGRESFRKGRDNPLTIPFVQGKTFMTPKGHVLPKMPLNADFITGDAYEACLAIAQASRAASLSRTTKETDIHASVAIDGTGRATIHTGLRFFDHMLEQLACHSGMDIVIRARGDLDVEEHHIVEDTGILLGEAIRKAMGNKRGMGRFGFVAPLDEATAEVVLDLCGRSFLTFNCALKREKVGDLPSELVEDFFKAFADGLGATLHISCRGRNDHHKIEAIFKSTARALKQAVGIDWCRISKLPSTKGRL